MVRRPVGFPPGPCPLPFIGNILQLSATNPLKDLERLSQRYGKIFSLYLGSGPVVVLTGTETIREALVTRAAEFSGRPDNLMISHITKGKGVILADYGPSWKEHRRFALFTLRNFGLGKRSMEERILEEISHISAELESHDGQSMDPQVLFHQAASNIICSLIFGERFEWKDPVFITLIKGMQELTALAIGPWATLYEICPALRNLPLPFRRAFTIYNSVKEHTQKVVLEHKKSRVPGKPRDLIDCYLDQLDKTANEDSTFDETQMIILLLDLFIAGTDTTSTTFRSLMIQLMNNQNIQERCHREIEAVMEGRPHPSYEDRSAMPYVQAVIHESQRFGDIVPLSVFHCTTCNTQLQGFELPKGTTVIPNLSSALHEESQWKFPHEFNPENFLNEDGEFVKPDAFMPFSIGPRVCLGEGLARMELFLITVTLLRQFQFVWPKDQDPLDPSTIFGAVQSPKPYHMGVCFRKSQRG
ncbi:cytochrome P450 2B4-like isoform X2 [Hypomesus transpacificus]|uniref:cytochrome P450 2B4-like isoform X2 n=1 Tax=Hypomesus transpacificus TaxID=137520 RepID=UPI001F075985|nr:cytochrome P450 2B4-like isoform X2 [Hypomesus transpacificus]